MRDWEPDSALGQAFLERHLGLCQTYAAHGHIATQVLAVRRLVDNRADVISLRRLLKDIRRNCNLFTRENYICHDGLPFDYGAVMQKDMGAKAGNGVCWGATSGPEAWGTSSMAHEQFDKLAGIEPKSRTREDRLPIALLDTTEGWLDQGGANGLADWSHAYLVHAGNLESRKRIADAIVTNNNITDTLKTIARVRGALTTFVLFV